MVTQLNNKKREFIGFLMGEGCFRVDRKKKKGYKERFLYRPQINISLRADDAEILKWAKKTYGGCLLLRQGRPQIPNQNPYYMWTLTSAKRCLVVLEDFLQAELSSAKKKQALLLRKFCEDMVKRWKKGHKGIRYRWYTEEEMVEKDRVYNKLKLLKMFDGVK